MNLPDEVKLVEVGPRDGLQNEPTPLPVEIKAEFIDRLSACGLPVIEAGSFVSAKWVPQMADSGEVLRRINRRPGTTYPVLVPNLRGLEDAAAAGAAHVAVVTAASETFCRKNTNCTVAESLARIEAVWAAAQANNISVRGYISCTLGCPYEGDVPPKRVAELAQALHRLGCREVSLGDTIGVGTPGRAQTMVEKVLGVIPAEAIAVHFHDTYGQALANILAALQVGVGIIDASAAGLGGCPYAPGAAGNVATEDVLYMLNGLGIKTGVDLDGVIDAGLFITEAFGRRPVSKVSLAHMGKKNRGRG
ncbi:MAG: hydroxymethylglutaryl-CoA lyase [Pseudomonadota bacterium]